MFARTHQENSRLKMITFCEKYLKDYPEPVFLHDQQKYVSECVRMLDEMGPASAYDLAYGLAVINEKVIAFDNSKFTFKYSIFEVMPGTFRLAMEMTHFHLNVK